jgi:hypothetical protein
MKMLTEHASIRVKQRGIPPLIRNWLIDFGKANYDGHGAIVRYFNKDSIRQMEKAFGKEPIRRMSEFLRCYLVQSVDGTIVTIGKRHPNSRINRA